MKEIQEYNDNNEAYDDSDEDWILYYPRSETEGNGDSAEECIKGRRIHKGSTKSAKLAPLIAIGKEVVYKPWNRRELKEIVGDFPKDVRMNKHRWLEEWDSVCTIYKPHMPDMLQLLRLTLPSNVRDKVIDACEIPRNPINIAKITPEQSQTYYSVIALAVQREVVRQIDFTSLTRIRQGKDENPREVYEKFVTTARDNCGLSQSHIEGLPPGYMQIYLSIAFIQQSKRRYNLQLIGLENQ